MGNEKLIDTYLTGGSGSKKIYYNIDTSGWGLTSGNEHGVGLAFYKNKDLMYATPPTSILYYWPNDAYGHPYKWYENPGLF